MSTLRVSLAGRATLPIAWRRANGLISGGPVIVVEVGDGKGSLMLTPIRPEVPAGMGLGLALLAMPPGMPAIPKHVLPSSD